MADMEQSPSPETSEPTSDAAQTPETLPTREQLGNFLADGPEEADEVWAMWRDSGTSQDSASAPADGKSTSTQGPQMGGSAT